MGKTALVLSGGGIKAAYEAGVLRSLAAAGVTPDVIVGISAGAVNGAMVAKLVAEGVYGPEAIDESLIQLWLTRTSMDDFFYTASGELAPGSLGEASVQRIFHRVGIDPFKRVIWLRLTLDALMAFRELVLGRWTSMVSHGYLKSILETYLAPPAQVVRPVTFSVAVSDLLGTTHLENRNIAAHHSHYETFRLEEQPPGYDREAQFAWMRSLIMASCSVPMVFPPIKMHLQGREKPGLYLDGGMVENWPITQAIELDPDVDTVFVVMAATVVGEPSNEPATFMQLVGRVFSIIAGRYLIQNYQDVSRMNERILAMREVLDRDLNGDVIRNARNEALSRAAGFAGLDGFLAKRYVRMIPIGPSEPLRGGIFSALFYPELKIQYLERGVLDGQQALRHLAQPLPS